MIRIALLALTMALFFSQNAIADWKGCQNLSNLKSALKHCTAVIDNKNKKDTERSASAHLHRGLIYLEQGLRQQALADFAAAIRLSPSSSRACLLYGAVFYHAREYSKAIQQYAKCIGNAPNYGAGYFARGRALSDNGQHAAAIPDFSRALDLEKDKYLRSDTMLARGKAYEQIGDHVRAIADYTGVVRAFPHLSLAYVPRGRAYEKIGKLDKALADYSKALTLEPGNKVAKSHWAGLQGRQQ